MRQGVPECRAGGIGGGGIVCAAVSPGDRPGRSAVNRWHPVTGPSDSRHEVPRRTVGDVERSVAEDRRDTDDFQAGSVGQDQEGETIVRVRGAAIAAGGIRIDPDAFRQPDRWTALYYRQQRRLKFAGPPDPHRDRESRQSKNHQNDKDQDKSTSHAHEVSSDRTFLRFLLLHVSQIYQAAVCFGGMATYALLGGNFWLTAITTVCGG